MFQKIKLTDIVIVIVIVLIAIIIGYYYGNSLARNKLWVRSYPIRAQLSLTNISCSNDSPSWLADILKHQTKNNNAPANQIAYIDPNGTLHHCENGYVGDYPLLSDSVTEQTRFRYASVTKLWTADAILNLIKADKLTLDTTLSSLLPEIDTPKDARISEITIRQLLSHRAGFNRYSVFGQDMFGIGKDICPNNLNGLNDIQLGFDPDSKTSYSNLGYCLLGEVISRLNEDKSYKDVIKKQYNFADSRIQFVSNSAMSDEVTYNYVETGLTGYADIYTAFDYDGLASAAGLSGNAIDLAKQVHVMAAKLDPNIMSLDNDVVCNGRDITEECYGYAMLPYQPNSQSATVYYRDGSLLGLSTLVAIDERGSVVALLSNGTPDTGVDHNVKTKIYEYLNR
ncbi:serine hydrolase domain-containing protein [Psychrobacter sp. DAB_AL62B]|uniref:serine hydrolase domain-containing protein n=1 Tax=Psychrobacter sp. DAB_AL62B TaxID=1028420 RepID=UPI00238140CF|nr:serine hydrolase domain-containing protein [Psychrobacter sp. DAB_AL62B]MDE4454492.1 class A beta-lactamase-related serine hydrolase [Psychrobacter sp. DAB_AL62B]